MRLTYRGVKYDRSLPTMPEVQHVAVGIYRGVPVPLHRGMADKSSQFVGELIYRGCRYSV